jgi:hypothetical protein
VSFVIIGVNMLVRCYQCLRISWLQIKVGLADFGGKFHAAEWSGGDTQEE